MDGHMGLANSVALRIAGITHNTEDPKGGTIMRKINGGKYRIIFVIHDKMAKIPQLFN